MLRRVLRRFDDIRTRRDGTWILSSHIDSCKLLWKKIVKSSIVTRWLSGDIKWAEQREERQQQHDNANRLLAFPNHISKMEHILKDSHHMYDHICENNQVYDFHISYRQPRPSPEVWQWCQRYEQYMLAITKACLPILAEEMPRLLATSEQAGDGVEEASKASEEVYKASEQDLKTRIWCLVLWVILMMLVQVIAPLFHIDPNINRERRSKAENALHEEKRNKESLEQYLIEQRAKKYEELKQLVVAVVDPNTPKGAQQQVVSGDPPWKTRVEELRRDLKRTVEWYRTQLTEYMV